MDQLETRLSAIAEAAYEVESHRRVEDDVIDADEMAAAFEERTRVIRVNPEYLGGRVPNPQARRVLLNVGLPGQVGYDLFFGGLIRGLETRGEFWRRNGSAGASDVDDHVLLGSGPDAGSLLLDGVTGAVVADQQGSPRLVSSRLDRFAEILWRIQTTMNTFEDNGYPDKENIGQYLDNTLDTLTEIDPEAVPAARGYWAVIVRALYLNLHG